MTTRTGIAVTLTLLFAGCASGAGSGDIETSVPRAPDRPPEVSSSGDGVYVNIQPERIISTHLITAPMERVW